MRQQAAAHDDPGDDRDRESQPNRPSELRERGMSERRQAVQRAERDRAAVQPGPGPHADR
jgi:hypothetical protein